MKSTQIFRLLALSGIIGCAGLFLWWFLMPAFLPVGDATDNFQNLVLDSDWIWVNLIGLISILFLIPGVPGYYLKLNDKTNKVGFAGLATATTGLVLYACIQYYETIIWPVVAQINPDMVAVDGALVSGNEIVVAGLLISGAVLGVGFILYGIGLLKTREFPNIPVWFMIVGAPVFGVGVVFPVRTIGLILFCTGLFWLSMILRRSLPSG